MTTSLRPHILSKSIAVCMVLLSQSAFGATDTVRSNSDGSWATGTNWTDNTAPATGGRITEVRLNINGPITYNFPGVTTILDTSSTPATANEVRPFGIASGSNTNGTLTVTAGTLTFTTESGGTAADKAVFITAAADTNTNANGTLHINGGNVIIDGGNSYLIVMGRGGATSTGTVRLDSGSFSVGRIDFGTISSGSAAAGATGLIEMNGGTMNIRSISSGNSVMTVNVKLNGGTIATSGAPVAGQDLIGANIDNATFGGIVTFNTALGDGIISTPFSGVGGITKVGTGTLSLTQAMTYTGATTVTAGTLATTTAQNGTSKIDVAGGATLAVSLAPTPASLTTGTLILGSSTGASVKISAGASPLSASVPVITAPSFSTGTGTTTIELSGLALSTGVYPLIDYNGTIGGAGASALSINLVNLPRASATLVNNTAQSRVDLNLSNEAVKWAGTNGNWDIDDSGTVAKEGTANWKTELTSNTTNYLQGSKGADAVIFDNTATGTRTITLTTTVSPTLLTVNNTTGTANNYKFVGDNGLIGGPTILTKNGTGTLIIANKKDNTYTGETRINAGKLQVGDGSIGAGSLGTGDIVMGGGTLELNRQDGLTLPNLITGTSGLIKTVSGGLFLTNAMTGYSGGIDVGANTYIVLTNTVTFNGPLSGNGYLDAKPASNRVVTLGGNNINFHGEIDVTTSGHLRITSGTALGSAQGGTIVTGGTTGEDLDSDGTGSSLQLSGGITVNDEWVQIRGTGGSSSGITSQRGALQSIDGDNFWNGAVFIAGTNTRIGVQDSAKLTISGTISDDGWGHTVVFRGSNNGTGMITLSGTGNQWGQTNVYGSTLRIAGSDNILPTNAPLWVGADGVGNSIFDLNGRNQKVAGISQFAGTATTNIITNNGATDSVLTIDAAATLNPTYIGVLKDGPTNKLSLVKAGSFTQTLSGVSTYTGTTTVNAGTLLVTGSISASAAAVNNGGTLGGANGILGNVTVNAGGKIAPGALDTVGTLTASSLSLNGDSIFALDINVGARTTDLMLALGNLLLDSSNSPILSITNRGSDVALALGTPFKFIDYNGTWNGGLFEVNGVPIMDDSGRFQLGANLFTIDYNYIDANGPGVALVVVPEPSTAGLLLGGVAGMLGFRRRRNKVG